MEKNIIAVWENIVIRKIDEATTSGIILWTDQDAPTRGEVIWIGNGVAIKDRDHGLAIWDIVYFSKHATDHIYLDGKKIYVMKFFSVLAKEVK